jgi:hypothetical protein
MLLAQLYTLPVDRLVCAALSALWHAGAISSGRGALGYVRIPTGLEPVMGPRALRLVRQSQVSAW